MKVLDWEKTEMQQVAERVAAIKAREMKVVEKRLSLEQAQLDADMDGIFRNVHTTREAAEHATELEWSGTGLNAKDAAVIAAWLKGNTTVKRLECAATPQTKAGARLCVSAP